MPVDIIEYYKNIKKSKICLNLHREDIFDIGNIRSFEIPGNKGFLLTDKSEELKNYFEYGKHYIGFLGYNDCLDKINYFLKYDKEREDISKQGQIHCLKYHTFENRADRILEVLNDYE